MVFTVTQFAWYTLRLPLEFFGTLFVVAWFYSITSHHEIGREEYQQLVEKVKANPRRGPADEYLAVKFILLGHYQNMMVSRWPILLLCLQAPLWMILAPQTMPLHLLGEAVILALLLAPGSQHLAWDILRPKLIRLFSQGADGGVHPSQPSEKNTACDPLRNLGCGEENEHGHRCDADTNGMHQKPRHLPAPFTIPVVQQKSGQRQNAEIAHVGENGQSNQVNIRVWPWVVYLMVGRRPSIVQEQPIYGSQQKRGGY
ncbi:protein of unknown function [Acidithiobacillus ferrivorans]|uniref:Uncharacterized protein n=1 Tax=Acidithiobacillus ferrivorans TaxID=160808 RepID=A0A060UTZ4_9PROT|nr:hypothetical protein [Acidithiobacillus ferrivorans]CDQ12072.1 hypothetical protein AFERRI_80021 [Acidithiobacillus ferrivorans]SMH64801.1 protein of unknown function [Acidithiobacillus ferrivorans]